MILKTCTNCNTSKHINEFYKRKSRSKTYLCGRCKPCQREYRNRWVSENRDKVNKSAKKYRENNALKVKESDKNYKRKKRESDAMYRMSSNIRTMICKHLKSNGVKKNTKSTNILGCTFNEFREYIESKFEPWMSWDKYGKYNGDFKYGFDIDHIIPLSSAKSKEDIIRLNHYTNLQPLCSKINRDIKKWKT